MPKKSNFSQIAPIIQGTILTCIPDNLVCFYTKNAPKVDFSQITLIIQGTIMTFVPGNVVDF